MIPASLTFGSRVYLPEPYLPPGEVLVVHNEDKNTNIFDWDVRPCAVRGCPAVMKIHDEPDTFFDRQWQYYLVAINPGMELNNIWGLLGPTKALTNRDEQDKVRNYILEENLEAKELARLDKLRTFSRNTHLAYRTVGGMYRLATMNGRKPPPLKPGRSYPQSLTEIDPDAYLYHPKDPAARPLFLVCNSVQVKDGMTSVYPFAHGALYDWFGVDPVTFFPLVSTFDEIWLDMENWTEVQSAPYPYRRVS